MEAWIHCLSSSRPSLRVSPSTDHPPPPPPPPSPAGRINGLLHCGDGKIAFIPVDLIVYTHMQLTAFSALCIVLQLICA